MKELSIIGEELFNKIRSRFPNVTIGDEDGTVTNDPKNARFFDFDFKSHGKTLGKVSVSVNEEDGVAVIYSQDFVTNEDEIIQDDWYSFLKELREFSRKRLLNFDARDITKSNLQKRDYKFLAQRSGDGTMTESKLYGTARVSYQKVGEARIMIKHTENINQESATGRTQKIGKIYIESPEGERFKYPYKHLTGARAMARHVAEGGNAYDDFGKHIVGLSEEMAKLRKFKNYMSRSAVMAESLAGYTDIVKERIATVKKEIASLQKPAYYKEAFETFNPPVLEDVPSDVAENWIDELTIKQFNEELQDIFPYIYNLVKEGTKAKELGPDDLVDESGLQYYTGKKKYGKEGMAALAKAGREGASEEELGAIKDKYKKTKEEFELEQAFEDTMGQVADSVCEECGNPSWRTLSEEKQKGVDGKVCWKGYKRMGTKMKGGKRVDNCVKVKEDELEEAYIKTRDDAVEALARLRGIGKKIETGRDTYEGNLANEYVSDVYDVYNWMDARLGISGMNEPKLKAVLEPVMQLRGYAKTLETKPGSGENARFGNQIVNALYPLMVYIRDVMEDPKDESTNESGTKAVIDIIANADDPEQMVMDLMKKGGPIGDFLYGELEQLATEAGKTFNDGETDPEEFIPELLANMGIDEGNAYSGAVAAAKAKGKKPGDKIKGPDGDEITLEKDDKTPLGEFILSYYDRETGKFPKGETAVLTMVEKDYGEQFIEPAKAFIEQVNQTFEEYQMRTQPQQLDTQEYNRMRELAGLR